MQQPAMSSPSPWDFLMAAKCDAGGSFSPPANYGDGWEWLPLPRNLLQGFEDTPEEVTEEGIVCFLSRFAKQFPPDDSFCLGMYHVVTLAATCAYARAANYLLKNQGVKAVYLFLLGSLMAEVRHRGPTHVRQFFEREQEHCQAEICAHFRRIDISLVRAQTKSTLRSELIYLLEGRYFGRKSEAGMQAIMVELTGSLQRVEKEEKDGQGPDVTLHSLPYGRTYDPYLLAFVTSNIDTGRKHQSTTYNDASLKWWLKYYVVSEAYIDGIGTESMTYDFVRCGGQTYHLSTSGDKTLRELGIQKGDELFVGGQLPLADSIDTDIFWQWLLPGTEELLSGYFAKDVNESNVVEFWARIIPLLPSSDKELSVESFLAMEKADTAAYVLAADFLLKGQNHKAIYMFLYAGMTIEGRYRGPDCIKSVFATSFQTIHQLCAPLASLYSAVADTRTRRGMIATLQEELTCNTRHLHAWKTLTDVLSRLTMQEDLFAHDDEVQLHSLELPSEYPIGVKIKAVNVDTGFTLTHECPEDMKLAFWLKHYAVKCNAYPILRHPALPATTKYLRVLHNGKTLFLSSSGKKTLAELGIRDGDELRVGGVQVSNLTLTSAAKKPAKKKKPKGKPKRKKKRAQPHSIQTVDEKQMMLQQRQHHSRALSRVLEEMEPLLKDIRQKLNDLTIRMTAPKVKARTINTKDVPQDPSNAGSKDIGKAGKVAYPVLVGEVSNLYKTSKTSPRRAVTLDLHGCSRKDALDKLNECLPVWVETAMKGEHPWVIPVDIVCGGGNQVLSETVRAWIRTKRQVANRPKGYI